MCNCGIKAALLCNLPLLHVFLISNTTTLATPPPPLSKILPSPPYNVAKSYLHSSRHAVRGHSRCRPLIARGRRQPFVGQSCPAEVLLQNESFSSTSCFSSSRFFPCRMKIWFGNIYY